MIIMIVRIQAKHNTYIGHISKEIEIMQIHTENNQKEIKEHGDYAFPVNVSEERIQDYEQDAFLWHWHPEVELTWIKSGEIEYHVNDKTYILHKGEGLFGNCKTLHSGRRIGRKECTYISITFHPRFLYGYENSILQTKYVDFITTNEAWESLKLSPDVDWQKEILDRIREIYGCFEDPPVDYELQVHLLLAQIWQNLYAYYLSLPSTGQKTRPDLQRLRDIISYLQGHYAEEISLDQVAAAVNICKSECCRFFKKHMNMTIFEYLLYLRIQNSLPLLAEGESVTSAAGKVGFSSPAYFGQIFKRYMKCTPREWAAER